MGCFGSLSRISAEVLQLVYLQPPSHSRKVGRRYLNSRKGITCRFYDAGITRSFFRSLLRRRRRSGDSPPLVCSSEKIKSQLARAQKRYTAVLRRLDRNCQIPLVISFAFAMFSARSPDNFFWFSWSNGDRNILRTIWGFPLLFNSGASSSPKFMPYIIAHFSKMSSPETVFFRLFFETGGFNRQISSNLVFYLRSYEMSSQESGKKPDFPCYMTVFFKKKEKNPKSGLNFSDLALNYLNH